MRTIKFRGWDTEDQVMVYKINSLRLFDGELKPDEYILMQFTGLKDLEGKDIYEGDIVKFQDWKPKEVSWLDKVAGYELKGILLWLSQNDAEKMKVIGNIHENPELLEVAS